MNIFEALKVAPPEVRQFFHERYQACYARVMTVYRAQPEMKLEELVKLAIVQSYTQGVSDILMSELVELELFLRNEERTQRN